MSRAVSRARQSHRQSLNPAAPRRAKQTNTRPTQWDVGEFVAIDGEGFSDGVEFDTIVGAKSTRYVGRDHAYAYLAASDGTSLYSLDGRLDMFQCLDFLCSIVERNPRAILVAFGGSYDVTHMVCHNLEREDVLQLLGKSKRKGRLLVEDAHHVYLLEYRPRKVFTISRWPVGAKRWEDKINKKTGAVTRVSTPHLTVRLWDVWGFFQDSFVGVMSKWLPDDPDYQFIKRMKGDRNIFERSEMDEIVKYNAAELRCLAKIMNRVRDAINDLGLKITRWDGAGAIAAAMMVKYEVKKHKGILPDQIFEAASCAYSGGHIEACKVGHYMGLTHHYDVNSAYPHWFRQLPSLRSGQWIGRNDDPLDIDKQILPPAGYTLVQVEWQFPPDLPFYPLFYRCEDGSILYPYRGSGWYWFHEYDVARRYYDQSVQRNPNGSTYFRVTNWFHFRSHTDERPFGWVVDNYEQRQHYIEAARRGGFTSGPEKIIKLGLNSLYGKTAQQVGAREDGEGNLRLPPFFQLDWAGFVTSGWRSQLMEAAIQNPNAIIGFATDGLFSLEPLDLYCPQAKELGAWEYELYAGITMVMPSVYWLHEENAKPKHYSRGFDKREMSDPEFVHQAWREKKDAVRISITRLVGLGSATASASYWTMRGNFATSSRSLCLDGDHSKRYPINLNTAKPWRELVDTIPRDHFMPNLFGIQPSAPYPVAWLDGVLANDRDLEE